MHVDRQTVPTKTDVLGSCASLCEDGDAFWRGLDADWFWSRRGVPWSPADNVRHLTMSTAPVARALLIPRSLLRVLFGVSQRPSRTWHALGTAYLDRLAAGATSGRYSPPLVDPPADPAAGQRRLVGAFGATVRRLERAVGAWRDGDLDRYRLPHPILGKLTLREMVMFTLFHCEHHRDNVARRSAGQEPHR